MRASNAYSYKIKKGLPAFTSPFPFCLSQAFCYWITSLCFFLPQKQTQPICILYFKLLFPGNSFHMFITKYVKHRSPYCIPLYRACNTSKYQK